MTGHIDIVFDGPPSHESGRFVEVEDADGKSISVGEWVTRPGDPDGWAALRIPDPRPDTSEPTADVPVPMPKKPTCWITLTSVGGEGYGDAVCSVSEGLRVWGNGHAITDVHPEATMIAVYPVQPVSHEECPLGQGAVKTASKPNVATFVSLRHIVRIDPAPEVEEVLF